jgi:hypothetical protein
MSTAMPASTFKHASQVDEPTFSASDLKAHLDSQAEEIIAWFNATHIGTDKIHIGVVSFVEYATSPTTTSASYADVTESAVVTTTGGSLLAIYSGTFSNDTVDTAIFIALSIDGSAEVGERVFTQYSAGKFVTVTTIYLFTGLSVGSHTIKPRWKTTGGTIAASANRRGLLVLEVKS